MFNSSVLDIFIGLIFIYLLYSLLITIIQELIATLFAFRAATLEYAIWRMLEDDDLPGFLCKWYNKWSGKTETETSRFAQQFYQHPLIKFLGQARFHSKPSYLKKETFSKVIIDLLRDEKFEPGGNYTVSIKNAIEHGTFEVTKIQEKTDEKTKEKTTTVVNAPVKIQELTKKYFQSIWIDSQGDVEQFRSHLETWFDETMERATGWYKKKIQIALFVISLIITISFNVDTIQIASKLNKDPKLREQVVQQANEYLKTHKDLQAGTDTAKLSATDKELNGKLRQKGEALILKADSLLNTDIAKANGLLGLGFSTIDWCHPRAWLMSLLGCLITTLAISLGAPFWFDLLNKLMKLRSSGPAPSSSQAETKKTPRQVVKRVG